MLPHLQRACPFLLSRSGLCPLPWSGDNAMLTGRQRPLIWRRRLTSFVPYPHPSTLPTRPPRYTAMRNSTRPGVSHKADPEGVRVAWRRAPAPRGPSADQAKHSGPLPAHPNRHPAPWRPDPDAAGATRRPGVHAGPAQFAERDGTQSLLRHRRLGIAGRARVCLRGVRHRPPRAGSDFPALLGFESYRRTFEYIKESRFSEQETDQILHQNVAMLFGRSLA